MSLVELLIMALRTITAKPLRTLLTMLGVIIGVGSVVTLVAIGQGTSAQIEKQYEGLGTNLIVANLNGNGRATQINYDNLMQLEILPEIDTIAPVVSKAGATVKAERESDTSFSVIGTNDRYMSVMKLSVAEGRFLVPADQDFRNQVAVIGSETAKTLFGLGNPIGQELHIDGVVYEVVGVLKEKGSNTNGTSADSSIIVPLSAATRASKMGSIRTAYLEAPTKDDVATAQATITQYLTYQFKSENGFRIQNQDELIKAKKEASSTLTNQLISVACISLLVGGIGIMNIMLVTVSERTREIGIRKSIGARRQHILLQFLAEAMVISGLGGILGLAFGVGAAWLWPLINPTQPTVVSLNIGLYALGFSVLVGIVFGLYPANQASRLKPIDALRFD